MNRICDLPVLDLRRTIQAPPDRTAWLPDEWDRAFTGERRRTVDVDDDALFEAVLGVWCALPRDTGGLPARRDFRPEMIARWLEHIVLTRVIDEGRDLVVSICGQYVDSRFRRRQARKSLVQLNEPASQSRLVQAYRETVHARAPRICRLDYIGPIREISATRSLFLPLADDAGTVGHILVAVSFEGDVPVTDRQTRWWSDGIGSEYQLGA